MKDKHNPGDIYTYSFRVMIWAVVLPFLAMFLLPFVMYGGQIRVRTVEGSLSVVHVVQTMGSEIILVALGIVAIWLTVAALAAWGGSRLFVRKSPAVLPPITARYGIFLIFSLVGSLCFIMNTILVFPLAVENVVHLMSMTAGVALGLGVALLASPEQLGRRLWLVRLLTLFLYLLMTFLPLALGKSYGAAAAMVLLVGTLLVVRARWTVTVLLLAVALFVLLLSMSLKTSIRYVLYEGKIFERIAVFPKPHETRDEGKIFERIAVSPKPHETREKRGPAANVAAMGDFLRTDMGKFEEYDQNSDLLILNKQWLGDSSSYLVQRAVHRLNHLGYLSLAIDRTPGVVPFWGGHLYDPLWFSLVPRFLWTDKPEANFANAFGRRYGILPEEDTVTSVNLNPITQAWVTGGMHHVIISGVLAGLLFGLIYGWLTQGGNQWFRMYVFLLVMLSVPSLESDAALAFGGLLQSLALALVLVLCSRLLIARFFSKDSAQQQLALPCA